MVPIELGCVESRDSRCNRGADPRFINSPLRVPAGSLRDREGANEVVLKPVSDLIKQNGGGQVARVTNIVKK